MKCIDPWLLNNRRQCPVCKRYVFPNHDNSDEEENNTHAATERTPLIQPSEDESVTALSRNRPTGKFLECHYDKIRITMHRLCKSGCIFDNIPHAS
jgi:hypothetical protein